MSFRVDRRRLVLAFLLGWSVAASPACSDASGPTQTERVSLGTFTFRGRLRPVPGVAGSTPSRGPLETVDWDALEREAASFGARRALISMGSVWCRPCEESTTYLVAHDAEARARGGLIVHVIVEGPVVGTTPTAQDLDAMIDRLGIRFPVLLDGAPIPVPDGSPPTAIARGPFLTAYWNTDQSTRSGLVVDLVTRTVLGSQYDSHITGPERLQDFYRYLP